MLKESPYQWAGRIVSSQVITLSKPTALWTQKEGVTCHSGTLLPRKVTRLSCGWPCPGHPLTGHFPGRPCSLNRSGMSPLPTGPFAPDSSQVWRCWSWVDWKDFPSNSHSSMGSHQGFLGPRGPVHCYWDVPGQGSEASLRTSRWPHLVVWCHLTGDPHI